jgi:hypothetical protein
MDPNEEVGRKPLEVYISDDWQTVTKEPGGGRKKVTAQIVTLATGRQVMYILDENGKRHPTPVDSAVAGLLPDAEQRKSWAEEQNKRRPPSGKTEDVVNGQRKGWNPDTRAYDIDLGPATATGGGSQADRERDAELRNEREWNARSGDPRASGRYESHAEREQRERGQRTEERSANAEERAAAAAERQAKAAEAADARANRPAPISAPDTQENIVQQNPDGSLKVVPNPNYNKAKVEAQAKKDDLATRVQQGQLTVQQATAEFDQWYKVHIQLPQQQAEEARNRAKEIREAQAAEDRRKEFEATYERERQKIGLQAGQEAVENERALLPHMVGQGYSGAMADAINRLSRGESGTNFKPEHFTFDRPDFEGISERATARALAAISPYAQAMTTAGERPLQTAEYPEQPPPPPPPRMPTREELNGMVPPFTLP